MDIQKAKIFSTNFFYKQIKIMLDSFGDFRKSQKNKAISKAFSEKIMLAVTQVNGCRLCSYVHTKNAVDAGVPESDLVAMTNGEFGKLDVDEAVALFFAQHYADAAGNYDVATYNKLEKYYGTQKAAYILANIRIIMLANIHGIALDSLRSRLKGNKLKGSKLKNELGIAVGIIILLPVAIVSFWIEKLFKRTKKQDGFTKNN